MVQMSDIRESKFFKLKKEQTTVQTIRGARMEQLNPEDPDSDEKLVVYWQDREIKPFVCNVTNFQSINEIAGLDPEGGDSDDWPGTQVELYFDTNVSFGGKRVGGIRVRKPSAPASGDAEAYRNKEVPAGYTETVKDDHGLDDDIPF